MNFLDPNHDDIAAMPASLKAMLDAELRAGNHIAEVSHGFPAPPCGACIKMANVISTPVADGIKTCSWPNWNRSSGYTDDTGHFFLLDPPVKEPLQPTMDEIRARLNKSSLPEPVAIPDAWSSRSAEHERGERPVSRFEASMDIDYEKWREGIGYDLDALKAASGAERLRIENKLIERTPKNWRDVEALAALDTPRARAALLRLLEEGSAEERMAVTRRAAHLVNTASRTASIIEALRNAVFYGGLTEALDEVSEFHPVKVMAELQGGLLTREGEVAVHFAAMLFYLYGKAKEPFDWNHRPFFLRFHTEDPVERFAVYGELCNTLGIDPDIKTIEENPAKFTPMNSPYEQAPD